GVVGDALRHVGVARAGTGPRPAGSLNARMSHRRGCVQAIRPSQQSHRPHDRNLNASRAGDSGLLLTGWCLAMSRAGRHGLMGLAVLMGLVGWLVVLAVKGTFSSGWQTGSRSAAVAMRPPARLKATPSSMRLPQPLHGATAASSSSGLLVIGGADRNDISTNQVLRLDPGASRGKSAGTLGAPFPAAAAAS